MSGFFFLGTDGLILDVLLLGLGLDGGLALGRVLLGAFQVHEFDGDLFPIAPLGAEVTHAIGEHLIFAHQLVIAVAL